CALPICIVDGCQLLAGSDPAARLVMMTQYLDRSMDECGLGLRFFGISIDIELRAEDFNGLLGCPHPERRGTSLFPHLKIGLSFQLYHAFLRIESGWVAECTACVQPDIGAVRKCDAVHPPAGSR